MYAKRQGINERFLDFAEQLHVEFARDHKQYAFEVFSGPNDGQVQKLTLKEYYEPRILAPFWGGEHEQHRPLGLGAVIAGIAGARATKGKLRRDPDQMEMFADKTLAVVKRFDVFQGLDPAGRKMAFEAFDQRLEAMTGVELERTLSRLKGARELFTRLEERIRARQTQVE